MGQRLFVVLSVLGVWFLYVNCEETMLFLKSIVLLVTCVYLSLQDVYYGILPDRIVLPLATAGVVFSLLDGGIGWENALLGGLVGGGALFFLRIVSRNGVGLGDVKFGMALGFWLGACHVALALWISYILGGLWAGYRLLCGASRRDVIPFGPCLFVSSMCVFAFQDAIWMWIWWWTR